eukprot:5633417-Ditylum_brightwellii.AAC.1
MKFIFKSIFEWKRTALKRNFANAPVILKYISNDVICDVKANTICADNNSGVEISDDVAFIYSVIEVSIKAWFQFVRKASVNSGHEEVICRYCKKCFLIVIGLAETCIIKIPFPTCIFGTLHVSASLNTELICWSAFESMIRPLSKEVFKNE